MNIDTISENLTKFDRKIALDLLCLIEKVQQQFERVKQEENYSWEDDLTPIYVNGKKYEILANLGFAEYFCLKRERVPFGFIARREDTQDIYIVFRGTSSNAEWISNFRFMQSSYEQCDNPSLCKSIPSDSVGRIHRGFYTTYTRPDLGSLVDTVYDFISHNNYDSMRDKIAITLKNCPKNSRLFVTGHSLGGALATISTLHIHFSKEIPFKPILYSFGSPRVGDQSFAQKFKNLECYRIANSEDIVPKVPLASLLLSCASIPVTMAITSFAINKLSNLNYEHIGTPIYFTLGTDSIAKNHDLSTYVQFLEETKRKSEIY